MKKFLFSLTSSLVIISALAQTSDGLVAKYYFNNATVVNEVDHIPAKEKGITFTDDRFGNPHSACYFHGKEDSYLNLGTSTALKPASGTFSLWVLITAGNYSGDGFLCNPILLTKNQPGNDFFEAYTIGYSLQNKKLVGACTLPKSNQRMLYSNQKIQVEEWYHAVLTYDDKFVSFYINGVLQNRISKDFRTIFLVSDSVMIGHSANVHNDRYLLGSVDDLRIYNRVLSDQEVLDLYNESDPNIWHIVVKWILIILGSLAGLFLIVVILSRKHKRELENIKEKNILKNQQYEMEIKVIKAQMNPHFIFNSMNSIQGFILKNDTESANTYLVKFSQLLRKTLESNIDEYISLENEISILEKYLEIECLRFEHAFVFEIQLDERLAGTQYRIPQMLIQPFVENAVWHGLYPIKEGGKITIKFEYSHTTLLVCTVEDNGLGWAKAQASKKSKDRKSLGIQFIRQRLELISKIWNNQYGVTIIDKLTEDGIGHGTRVIVAMPLIQNNAN
jgi:Concanavalin A-like lectin/glucanases superfamily/Histidine kinase